MSSFQPLWTTVVVVTLGAGFSARLYGQESVKQPAKAESGAKNAQSEQADEGVSKDDQLEVPDGTPEELLEFIDQTRRRRSPAKTRDAMIADLKQSLGAINLAADKILAASPEAKPRAAAIAAKLEALARLSQFDDARADGQLKKFAAELVAGKDPEMAKQAKSLLIQLRARKLMTGDVKGAEDLFDEVKAAVAADPNDKESMRVALGVAQALEYSGKTDQLAIRAYSELGELLKQSSDPDVSQYADKLAAVVRRLKLIGNPIEITGTLLDGHPFDQDALKGKVVLVDFWATWCGPCVAELPNVKKAYENYHDKGFEVVGISLDDDRETLEKFVEEREIPWPILFEDASDTKGWSNPLAAKYGIMGIPTVILVGVDGKVVSLKARGDELNVLLAKLLGPVEKQDSDESKSEAEAKK